ncbi:hypothetical protein [Clostridioides sp. ES-S-0123-01]|uniref:hypothetical protein n=1 Tax=Clostridioides sp. ES-S-0123-01 TaxID=2770783 RepID=UPI001D116EEE
MEKKEANCLLVEYHEAKVKIKGFINMVVFAAVIPSLAKVSLTGLISLFVPIVGMFAVSIIDIFIMMKVLPGWKIIGSKPLAFGVGFCQMLGFPTTYLMSKIKIIFYLK